MTRHRAWPFLLLSFPLAFAPLRTPSVHQSAPLPLLLLLWGGSPEPPPASPSAPLLLPVPLWDGSPDPSGVLPCRTPLDNQTALQFSLVPLWGGSPEPSSGKQVDAFASAVAGRPSLARVPAICLVADTTSLARSLGGLDRLDGWAREESLRVYRGNALFDLVDGGAALYLEYGFVRAFAMRFARGESRLSVELYQMSGSGAAFGLYSYLAAGSVASAAPYGQEGGRGEGFIVFWKGACAVTVTTLESDAVAGLDLFASAVDSMLSGGGVLPGPAVTLRKLSAGDLVFFQGPLGYQKARGLLPPELLRVGEGAEGKIEGCTVALLQYESADTCRSILQHALANLASGSASAVDRHPASTLVNYRDHLYSLECIGNCLLQASGTDRTAVEHAASLLRLSIH